MTEPQTPSLRSWLKKHPHPAYVVATTADGDEKTVKLGIARSRFRDAEDTLLLISAVKLEAYDTEKNVLRVLEFDEDGAKEGTKTGAKSELAQLAKIITESNDAAVARVADILNQVVSANHQLVQTLSARNAALEKAWHSLLMAQQSAADGDPNEGMVAVLAKAMAPAILPALMGQMNPEAKTPNGKAKT